MGRVFRLVTWNIHGCVGSDRRFDLSRVAEVLRQLNFDVAALQEVGDFRQRMPSLDQARALAAEVGAELAWAPNVTHGRRTYGNAILSKHPIVKRKAYDLSVAGKEPRGCVRADVDLGGEQVHVFNLHLGLSTRERRQQQTLLLSADILKDAALSFPLVVCGDFNQLMPGPVRGMLRRALVDVAVQLQRVEPTFHSRVPILRLDRMLVDRGLLPRRIRAVDDLPLARQASDHLPLLAELELVPREQPEAAPVMS